jgi:hypothetical protein
MPDDVLAQYDVTDDLQNASGDHRALIPAEVLNRLGKPAVYDHELLPSLQAKPDQETASDRDLRALGFSENEGGSSRLTAAG